MNKLIRKFRKKIKKIIKLSLDFFKKEKFIAVVKTGKGSSSKQGEYYVENISKCFGVNIFPGTLNVGLSTDLFLKKPYIFSSKKGKYCVWPIKLNGCSCYAVKPPRAKNWPNSLEIIADFIIRDKFNLKNGDTVEIIISEKYIDRDGIFLNYKVKPIRYKSGFFDC